MSTHHRLPAGPDTCFWGYFDAAEAPVLTVDSGDTVEIEAVTHHAGDAPDLLMDEAITAIWAAIAEADRAPGVHVMTGPIEVTAAQPGDALVVEILEMWPRPSPAGGAYGSNCAAHWGRLYEDFGKERITIYEIDGFDPAVRFVPGGDLPSARPRFGFDFTQRDLYDRPGTISPPESNPRARFSQPVAVPVRPHFGVIGVAPPGPERVSSVPPGVFGGNVDNWRFGPGATIRYPVFHPGARFYVGDPHFAQGDGEICGTAIEASLSAVVRLSLEPAAAPSAPLYQDGQVVLTHGFGADLDEAMLAAARSIVELMVVRYGVTRDEAYSLASVAVDLGITQVVDGVVGCHAALDPSIFNG